MATTKGLSLICEIPKFANAYLGKVTKFQGHGLFHCGVLSNLLALSFSLTSANLFFSHFEEIYHRSLSFTVQFVSNRRDSKMAVPGQDKNVISWRNDVSQNQDRDKTPFPKIRAKMTFPIIRDKK